MLMIKVNLILLPFRTFLKENHKFSMEMEENIMDFSIKNHLHLMEKELLSLMINQGLMVCGKKEKCMGKDIFHGLMDHHTEENINMAGNMELVDFCSLQESIMRDNGFTVNKAVKALCLTKIMQ